MRQWKCDISLLCHPLLSIDGISLSRVGELEEENSRLQALAEKGKKYDDLLSNLEQLRLRLSVAEKRERELTVKLANRTAANLAVKTESHDLNLPPTSYSSYAAPIGQASIITVMVRNLLAHKLGNSPDTRENPCYHRFRRFCPCHRRPHYPSPSLSH